MTKWGRNYKLTIKEDGKEQFVIEYPLTLELVVSRSTWSMSGEATFRIYNLSKETRGKIYKNQIEISRMIKIRLEAGYGDNLSTVFDGDVLWARSSRVEGQVNFITEISAFDAGFAKVNSTSDWTVEGSDASKDKVIRRLVGDLKNPIDGVSVSLPIGAIGVFSDVTRGKFTASGNTWDLLKTETGGNCFIDNGRVFCISSNEAIIGDMTEISNDTGLLGTPRVDGIYLYAEMVFEPGLQIGQQIFLSSDSLDSEYRSFGGLYKVVGIDHSGVISGAVSGKLKTRVTLMVGSQGQTNPLSIITS